MSNIQFPPTPLGSAPIADQVLEVVFILSKHPHMKVEIYLDHMFA
jgi:hypothetical protein